MPRPEHVRLVEELQRLAHDVRNPLAAADGLLELVLDPGIPSDVEADVALARESIREAMGIIAERLDLARRESAAARDSEPS